ncbi:hypothetical protein HDU98_009402 [Podochytrium sp. JEL0797]|nr:hypothetical protein HDU98_009402 [Podochytrium sp. JEL0797]
MASKGYSGTWIHKGAAVMLLIGVATAVVWTAAILTYRSHLPSFTGLLILAYTLGLRHAMDADHIAAIDNVTRRLIQDGQEPVTVGTFFSLGHSTIVILATFLVAVISSSIASGYDNYNNVAQYVGTSISATFLILIGTLNGYSAWCTYKEMKRIKNQEVVTPMDWQEILNNGGFFTRLFGLRVFKLINRPWKMYFVGFLFGLVSFLSAFAGKLRQTQSFDTATEIYVLAISIAAHQSSDSWYILFLPALFTVGMCMIDTMDGIMMSGVYGCM